MQRLLSPGGEKTVPITEAHDAHHGVLLLHTGDSHHHAQLAGTIAHRARRRPDRRPNDRDAWAGRANRHRGQRQQTQDGDGQPARCG
jgi:hypothetical protein